MRPSGPTRKRPSGCWERLDAKLSHLRGCLGVWNVLHALRFRSNWLFLCCEMRLLRHAVSLTLSEVDTVILEVRPSKARQYCSLDRISRHVRLSSRAARGRFGTHRQRRQRKCLRPQTPLTQSIPRWRKCRAEGSVRRQCLQPTSRRPLTGRAPMHPCPRQVSPRTHHAPAFPHVFARARRAVETNFSAAWRRGSSSSPRRLCWSTSTSPSARRSLAAQGTPSGATSASPPRHKRRCLSLYSLSVTVSSTKLWLSPICQRVSRAWGADTRPWRRSPNASPPRAHAP